MCLGHAIKRCTHVHTGNNSARLMLCSFCCQASCSARALQSAALASKLCHYKQQGNDCRSFADWSFVRQNTGQKQGKGVCSVKYKTEYRWAERCLFAAGVFNNPTALYNITAPRQHFRAILCLHCCKCSSLVSRLLSPSSVTLITMFFRRSFFVLWALALLPELLPCVSP